MQIQAWCCVATRKEISFWQPGFPIMRFLFQLGLLALSWVVGTQATALDDYVWAHDDNYKWTDMVINFFGAITFKDSLSSITTKTGTPVRVQ
jgi:hypothetical protein